MKEADGAPDALFFHQLLLPIHNLQARGEIPDDPRMPYYSHVAECSNDYAVNDLQLGKGYGHPLKLVDIPELVKWDGSVIMDGVLGQSKGAMLQRFDCSRDDNTSYSPYIAESMTKTRWLEIKRLYKLNKNGDIVKRPRRIRASG